MPIYNQDCLEGMKLLDENSIDSIVTDSPYGLNFMGKGWDHGVPGIPYWHEALRVCKPGAHMLAFGGTRTHHRLMVAIEDAGWEIRDTIGWVYGSGFPKSRDVWKNDICPEIERQLKEQGVVGVIEWK
jgi:DNA modification methylase